MAELPSEDKAQIAVLPSQEKAQASKLSPQDQPKLESYIRLYSRQMDRFDSTQDVEWKANFGLWGLLAGATYLAANKSVEISAVPVGLFLAVVCWLHYRWLIYVHDSQQIDKDLWNLYRDKAAEILGCAPEQQKLLSDPRLHRQDWVRRNRNWTSFEVFMTFLLCVLLFVMPFPRAKPVDLNM